MMMELGSPAPDFSLKGTDGKVHSLASFKAAKALAVIFSCNHCPYVQAYEGRFVQLQKDLGPEGFQLVAINANDSDQYAEDGFEAMVARAQAQGFNFPYLRDETQEVAKAYAAACTPDFFVFDTDGRLVYRGQLDDSRPKNDRPVTGRDLRAALDAVLAHEPPAADQFPSLGCNIKWRKGNEPTYFPTPAR